MSSGNPHPEQPSLTLDARKHLLLVACTIDRLHLLNTWRRPAGPESWLAQLGSPPWLEFAVQSATRLLPRRLRFLLSLLRTWSRMKSR